MRIPVREQRETRRVTVRDVAIGGDARISVQTMVKQPTTHVAGVLEEIQRTVSVCVEDLGEREQHVLGELGAWRDAKDREPFRCDLTRVGLPNREAAEPFGEIVSASPLPVVADIHFHAKLALTALEKGCHKLRINPGNIGDPGLLREIAQESKRRSVPIRVGVNAGSLQKDLLEKHGPHSPGALAESAMRSVELMENVGMDDLVISLKANTAKMTIDAYRIVAAQCDYPLHLGVTEAGFGRAAVVNSWAGIGVLLREGIGDTLRVSLTEDPALEVVVGALLLKYLDLR